MSTTIHTFKPFKNLLDISKDAIVVTDLFGQIIETNSGVPPLFGYTRNELRQLHLDNLLPEIFYFLWRQWKASESRGIHLLPRRKHVIFTARRKDGTEFPANVGFNYARIRGESFFDVAIRQISTEVEIFQSAAETNPELLWLGGLFLAEQTPPP